MRIGFLILDRKAGKKAEGSSLKERPSRWPETKSPIRGRPWRITLRRMEVWPSATSRQPSANPSTLAMRPPNIRVAGIFRVNSSYVLKFRMASSCAGDASSARVRTSVRGGGFARKSAVEWLGRGADRPVDVRCSLSSHSFCRLSRAETFLPELAVDYSRPKALACAINSVYLVCGRCGLHDCVRRRAISSVILGCGPLELASAA